MFARKAVILSTFLAATAAFAQAPAATDAAATELDPGMSVMKPGNIDVRGMIETDILLVYVNLGGVAELGLIPLGPGTLAVGAEVDYGFCGSICWVVSGLTEINIGERYFTPMARASYHFTIPALKIAHKLDLFGSLGVGLTFASVNLDADDNSFTSSASSTAFTIAPGVGVNYFANPNFFVGGELRYRVASGTYEYRVTSGNTSYVYGEEEQQWSLTGLGINLFLGYRF
jgi:hypothetical protein